MFKFPFIIFHLLFPFCPAVATSLPCPSSCAIPVSVPHCPIPPHFPIPISPAMTSKMSIAVQLSSLLISRLIQIGHSTACPSLGLNSPCPLFFCFWLYYLDGAGEICYPQSVLRTLFLYSLELLFLLMYYLSANNWYSVCVPFHSMAVPIDVAVYPTLISMPLPLLPVPFPFYL